MLKEVSEEKYHISRNFLKFANEPHSLVFFIMLAQTHSNRVYKK